MYKLAIVASTMFCAAALSAAPIACPTATAAIYTTTVNSAGGCTEDGLLFSQFNYITTSSGTALSLPATALAISPLLDLNGTGLGFQIAGGFAAVTGGIADGILQYEVSTLSGAPFLNGLSLSFNGTFTGSGIAGVSENYCPGGTVVPPTTCSGGLGNIFVQESSGTNKLQTSAGFANSNSVTVSKDIQVNGSAALASSATISVVSNQFKTVVPEPSTLLPIGGGLLAIGLIGKRLRKA